MKRYWRAGKSRYISSSVSVHLIYLGGRRACPSKLAGRPDGALSINNLVYARRPATRSDGIKYAFQQP
jgi:hypothetical protein